MMNCMTLLKRAAAALAAGALAFAATPDARGMTMQTPLSFSGAYAQGIAVDATNNEYYTLWLSGTASVDPVVVYSAASGAVVRTLPASISPFDSPQAAVIARGASTEKIRDLALRTGTIPLRSSGLEKVFDGVTTIEEVVRETVSEG